VVHRSNTSQDFLQSLCTSTLSEISHLSTPLISLTKPTRAGQLNSLALDPYTHDILLSNKNEHLAAAVQQELKWWEQAKAKWLHSTT
jgi:hypothetical protein